MSIRSNVLSVVFLFFENMFFLACLSNCCTREFLSITNETDEDIYIFYKDKLPFDKNKGVVIYPHCEKEFSMIDVNIFSKKDHIDIIGVSDFWIDENIKHKNVYRFNFDCFGNDGIYYIYVKDMEGKLYYEYFSEMKNDIKRRNFKMKSIIKDQLRKK